MSEQQAEQKNGRVLTLVPTGFDLAGFEEVLKALGSDQRLTILQYLGTHTCPVLEIAGALGWPPSTVTLHVNTLEHAGLIRTEIRPASRGLRKVCARMYDRVTIQLPFERVQVNLIAEVAMPLGACVDVRGEPNRGLLGPTGIIGRLKVWKVTAGGSCVDGVRVSDMFLDTIDLNAEGTINIRIGVSDYTHNVGGINL